MINPCGHSSCSSANGSSQNIMLRMPGRALLGNCCVSYYFRNTCKQYHYNQTQDDRLLLSMSRLTSLTSSSSSLWSLQFRPWPTTCHSFIFFVIFGRCRADSVIPNNVWSELTLRVGETAHATVNEPSLVTCRSYPWRLALIWTDFCSIAFCPTKNITIKEDIIKRELKRQRTGEEE